MELVVGAFTSALDETDGAEASGRLQGEIAGNVSMSAVRWRPRLRSTSPW
jgi:hypothetical protein